MDDDFEKWVNAWANAEQELAKERLDNPEPEPEPPVRTSFFSNFPSDQDYQGSDNDDPDGNSDWNNLYSRAMEIDYSQPETLITDSANVAYMGSEGYGKEIPKGNPPTAGGKKVYTNNPINFSSVGNDQQDDDGRVRVTKNWSDGEELQELSDISRRVEEMERRVHGADVLKKKDSFGKLRTQLESLRKRVRQLSEKIVSNPQDDLT